jgi:basic membrane protein A and related proteins
MRRFLTFAGVACVLVSLAVNPVSAHSLPAHHAKHAFTFGLVTDVGGINDRSFNHLAYLGLQQAEVQYHVRASYIQSTNQNDYVPNLTHFARAGADLTIGVGFLMESAIYTVATQYPNRKFALIDGAPTDAKGNTVNLPNVANLFFREQQSGYLVGVIAGLMEKQHVGRATHNTIGFMGGVSIPPVNRYIAGYVAGARHVDPGVKILRGYSQSFTDETKGKAIGLQQISLGADILFQVAGSSGLGYLAAAQEKGVYGIGVDSDQGFLGSYIITSALKKVDAAVRLTVFATLHHHFRSGDHQFDLSNGSTGFAPVSKAVPASIAAQANIYSRLIASGKIVPPTNIPS